MDRSLPISPDTFEEIESYLRHQMTAEKQLAFEQRLATDVLLQDSVRQVQLMLTSIQEVSLSASLNHFHSELPVSNNATSNVSRIVAVKRWMIAASVIFILALGSWFLFKKSSNEKLFADYFQPDPGLISAMSTTDNYVFDKAMIDYKTGNYTAAINAWKGVQQNNLTNDTLNYFIGTSYLAIDSSKEAIPYLQRVTKASGSYFIKDACWYLGLAWLNEGNIKEAAAFIERSEHPQKTLLLQQLKESTR